MTNIPSSSGLGRPYASHAHQDAVFNMQMSVCSVLQRLMYNPFTFDNREIGKPNSYIPDLVLLADNKLNVNDVEDGFIHHELTSERKRLAVVEFCHTKKSNTQFEADKKKVNEMMNRSSSI